MKKLSKFRAALKNEQLSIPILKKNVAYKKKSAHYYDPNSLVGIKCAVIIIIFFIYISHFKYSLGKIFTDFELNLYKIPLQVSILGF